MRCINETTIYTFVWAFMLLILILLPPMQAAAADDWSSEVLLNEFNGTILGFDESRIIWKETGDKVLWLYNRTDGSEVKVYDATGSDYTIYSAKLSTEGVVFTLSITDPSGWPTYRFCLLLERRKRSKSCRWQFSTWGCLWSKREFCGIYQQCCGFNYGTVPFIAKFEFCKYESL